MLNATEQNLTRTPLQEYRAAMAQHAKLGVMLRKLRTAYKDAGKGVGMCELWMEQHRRHMQSSTLYSHVKGLLAELHRARVARLRDGRKANDDIS
mgnify:CR=1 FL=1